MYMCIYINIDIELSEWIPMQVMFDLNKANILHQLFLRTIPCCINKDIVVLCYKKLAFISQSNRQEKYRSVS